MHPDRPAQRVRRRPPRQQADDLPVDLDDPADVVDLGVLPAPRGGLGIVLGQQPFVDVDPDGHARLLLG